MIARTHHLNDERLLDRYVAVRASEMADPPEAEHLADCAACTARYEELVAFMDGVREDGDAETDGIFSADRLRTQQQQIARRLEHVGRSAHVLSFPGQIAGRRLSGIARGRSVTRWIYAAAAAGLVFGVGIGSIGGRYDSTWRPIRRARHVSELAASAPARIAPITPVATNGARPAPDPAADEAFLSELEVALERPRTRELQAFDALTPHVRDVSDRVR